MLPSVIGGPGGCRIAVLSSHFSEDMKLPIVLRLAYEGEPI
jgi:hypothetical protein